jgi:hypothetical protein
MDLSHLRFSPKGDRLAFIDHPLLGDDGGTISVIDLSGKKSVLTDRWASAFGLAWSHFRRRSLVHRYRHRIQPFAAQRYFVG